MLRFLFKHLCIFCDDLTNRKLDLCVGCEKDLPFLENCCIKCAQKLPADQMICGSCLNDFSNITTKVLFEYQIPVDQIILNFKFHDGLIKGNVLSVLFAEHLDVQYKNEIKPELIIPVPLHKSRLRKRGYNQALEIARPIAKRLNIPIDKCSVIRSKSTKAQATLPLKERKQNIKNAFQIKKNLEARYVAIVDDVITTGNTVKELCKVLQKAGVVKIDIWCLAKSQFG